MNKTTAAWLNKELKAIVKNYSNSYESYHRASYEKFKNELPAGSTVPEDRRPFYDNVSQYNFDALCADLKADAARIIDAEINSLKNKANEAPTQEALTVVQMLALRSNINETELTQIMEAYGGNAITYETIKDIAAQKGMYIFSDNPIFEDISNLEFVKDNMKSSLTRPTGSIIASTAAMEVAIDEACPIE